MRLAHAQLQTTNLLQSNRQQVDFVYPPKQSMTCFRLYWALNLADGAGWNGATGGVLARSFIQVDRCLGSEFCPADPNAVKDFFP